MKLNADKLVEIAKTSPSYSERHFLLHQEGDKRYYIYLSEYAEQVELNLRYGDKIYGLLTIDNDLYLYHKLRLTLLVRLNNWKREEIKLLQLVLSEKGLLDE